MLILKYYSFEALKCYTKVPLTSIAIIVKKYQKNCELLSYYVCYNSKVMRNIGNFNVYNESKRIESKQKHAAYCWIRYEYH